MDPSDLKKRTKQFALETIRLVDSIPSNRIGDIIGRQLLRSGTSVGANYRSACRARSKADFISKMGIVEEEADESMYWLELLEDSGLVEAPKLHNLRDEANAIVSITVSSIKTARSSRTTK
jgi:four helix bundle protein